MIGAFLGLMCVLIPLTTRAADPALHIGSKRFTESYIVARILAGAVEPETRTEVLAGLGNTAIVYAALRSGRIDLYPEYLGTIDREILKNPEPTSIEAMNRQLAPLGLGVAVPLGFNDGYALAMRADLAERLGIRSLGDLKQHADLRFGLSNEFIGRGDGWPGLVQRYGFTQRPIGIDHGIAYDALGDANKSAQVDVIDIYTTDAQIEHRKLRVLADDQHYFPRYDAVLLYRLDVPQRFPAAWQALQRLQGSIDEREMIAMNARAEIQGVPFETIAADHLQGRKPATDAPRGLSAKLFGPDLARLTTQHLALVLISVALAVLIGLPLAVAVAARPVWRAWALGATGLLQTIPSLAMLAVLISAMGRIGTLPALVALTLYALLPIVRNTCTGLAEVPGGLKQAAMALGLSRRDTLLQIELPLAFPTIIAGIRTATIICVGTATLAAFIGAGGYGERIVTGLALNDNGLMLAGALPAAVLALLFEGGFEVFERVLKRRHGGDVSRR